MQKSIRLLGVFLFSLLFLFSSSSHAGFLVKSVGHPDGDLGRVLSIEQTDDEPETPLSLRNIPEVITETFVSSVHYRETHYSLIDTPPECFHYLASSPTPVAPILPKEWEGKTEVRTLVQQGPDRNRIKLVMVGDGYQEREKEKFFEDAKRITESLFTGSTFATYRPLFNVYAVFVPSVDSGITDKVKRDTALGLYRDPPGSLRAIMPGKYAAIERALSLSPAKADYPILIANDDFYGGLGGRYAITTRSIQSGNMVLRHELGHNFGKVGEEYDGGQVYSGANNSRSGTNVTWKQWLTSSEKPYIMKMLAGDYYWQDLLEKPVEVRFNFPQSTPEKSYRTLISFSAAHWESEEAVSVTLDGKVLQLEGNYSVDRSFFQVHINEPLRAGEHMLRVQAKNPKGNPVLGSLQIYAIPNDYDERLESVNAYATFYGPGQIAGYRPTHQTCLMRNMLSLSFCPVCIENMWGMFLRRVRLIDNVLVSQNLVVAESPALAGLNWSWWKQSEGQWIELESLRGKKAVPIDSFQPGRYQARVQFRTPEVRNYNPRFDDAAEFKWPPQ